MNLSVAMVISRIEKLGLVVAHNKCDTVFFPQRDTRHHKHRDNTVVQYEVSGGDGGLCV